MVDEEPVLEMLACVGEVDAERLEGAARGSIARVGVEPDEVAAEGHRDVAHRRIATDDDIVLAQVDRIVRPPCRLTKVTWAPSATSRVSISE